MRRLISFILLLIICWTAFGQETKDLRLYKKAFRYIRKDFGGRKCNFWVMDWLCDYDRKFFAEDLDLFPVEKKLAETYYERTGSLSDSAVSYFPSMKDIAPRERENVKYVVIFSPIRDNMFVAEVIDIYYRERWGNKRYNLSSPNGLRDALTFGETDQFLFVVKSNGMFLTIVRARIIYN